MANGVVQPTGLDPILETFRQLQEQFADPVSGRRAETFALGQERRTADLMQLFEQSQQPQKRTLASKITPILEGIALIADATSGSRRRRSEALPKYMSIRREREEQTERKREERRRSFADRANILGLIGEGKAAAFGVRRGVGREEQRRKEALLGLAIKARPKPMKGVTISTADQRKIDAGKTYEEAWTYVARNPDGGYNWADTHPDVRRAITENASILGYENPVPDMEKIMADLEAVYYERAKQTVKDSEMVFDDAQARESYISTLAKNTMRRDYSPPRRDEGEEEIGTADFSPAIEAEEPGLSLSDIFPDVQLGEKDQARQEALLKTIFNLGVEREPRRIQPPAQPRRPGALPSLPVLQQ